MEMRMTGAPGNSGFALVPGPQAVARARGTSKRRALIAERQSTPAKTPMMGRVRALLRSLVGSLIAAALCVGAGRAAEPPSDELAAKARRGKEAMAAGRFAEAAGLYAEIVRALPGEPGMLLNLGMALAMSGRAQEAVPHLQAALKLRPDLLPASLFLGSAYMELGQPARAVDPLQTVVAAQPDNHDARQMLADALLSLERYEPAAQHFR